MLKNKVTITNIFWKRTYLFIEYDSHVDVKLSIVRLENNKKDSPKIIEKHIFDTKKIDKYKYRAKMNITIAEGRDLLKSGNWVFVVDDDLSNTPNISEDILFNIEEYSRIFPYAKNFYAYVITFNVSKNKEDKELLDKYYLSMHVDYYQKNFKPHKRKWSEIKSADSKKESLRLGMVMLSKKVLNCYYQIVSHITPKNGKRILFMSENRDHIMDNLEAIDTRLKERGLDQKFKISYSFRNIFKKKSQNPFRWLKVITLVARQDYIFVDDYVPIFSSLNLHKKTTLVQVWHAGFGFKLVGYGRFGIDGSPHPSESCHRKYTYGLVGNNNLKEIYSEVWGIEKSSLLATGMPRLEHFLEKDRIAAIREKLYSDFPQFKGKKIINFAPTYRGSDQYNAYYDYSKLDFDRLADYCKKNNAIFIFGKHHFIRQEIPIKKSQEKYLYDMSKYKLNDTFYITDVLITDYSSCFYDFLLLKKPIIFYTYDRALYSSTRGVHRPIDKVAPGTICDNFDELMTALNNIDKSEKEVKDFLVDKCLTNKVLASDQVINYILLHEDVEGL